MEHKTCRRCNKEFPATNEYYYMSQGKFRPECKECSGHKFMTRKTSKDTIKIIDNVVNKTCLTCGETKPINEYYFNKSINNYSGTCKKCVCICVNENSKKKKKEHTLGKINGIPDGYSECIYCKKIKNSDSFRSLNSYNLNKTGVCKNCYIDNVHKYEQANHERLYDLRTKWAKKHPDRIKKFQKKSYDNNKQKIMERNKEWYKNNPDWARTKNANIRAKRKLAEGYFSKSEWENCKETFAQKCAYCDERTKLEIEHVVPLSKGGKHLRENIIPSCRMCNSSKGVSSLSDWYPKYKYYSKEREAKILDYLKLNI